ncbi:MAG: hypothetical protein PVI90_05750, partial [Desulfobacteraceae bacterium]
GRSSFSLNSSITSVSPTYSGQRKKLIPLRLRRIIARSRGAENSAYGIFTVFSNKEDGEKTSKMGEFFSPVLRIYE